MTRHFDCILGILVLICQSIGSSLDWSKGNVMGKTSNGLGSDVITVLRGSRRFGIFGEYVPVPIDYLPDKVGRRPSEISRYLHELESKGIVELRGRYVKLVKSPKSLISR